ncbi:putative membrane protein [Leifsonia sp. EB41]|uniref:SRPBCC family protein n=1 Tax=Leifsonia sp. EB41 TaxID=3156260 RepID=UPI003517B3BD
MAAVTESIDVSVPISTAFNQWTQFESFPHCLEEVEDVQQLDATRNRWRVRIGGQERV